MLLAVHEPRGAPWEWARGTARPRRSRTPSSASKTRSSRAPPSAAWRTPAFWGEVLRAARGGQRRATNQRHVEDLAEKLELAEGDGGRPSQSRRGRTRAYHLGRSSSGGAHARIAFGAASSSSRPTPYVKLGVGRGLTADDNASPCTTSSAERVSSSGTTSGSFLTRSSWPRATVSPRRPVPWGFLRPSRHLSCCLSPPRGWSGPSRSAP